MIIPINEDTISTRYLSSAKTVIYPGDPRSTLKALLKFINAFRYNALVRSNLLDHFDFSEIKFTKKSHGNYYRVSNITDELNNWYDFVIFNMETSVLGNKRELYEVAYYDIFVSGRSYHILMRNRHHDVLIKVIKYM